MAFPFKLGKLAPKPLKHVGFLSDYAILPTAPNFVIVPTVTAWQMLGNDQYGDCTMAGAAHLDIAWNTEVAEQDAVPSSQEVVKEYFSLTGGQDSGLAETDVLTHWQSKGLFGYKISAYAPVPATTISEIQQAVAFYGGCYLGVNLPQSAQTQFNQGGASTWSVVPNSPIEGGHCIVAVGYNNSGLQIISWGQVVTATYDWITTYNEEAYAIIPQQFVQAGKGPELDLASLQADLAKL